MNLLIYIKNQIVPYPEQVQGLALPDPSGKPPQMVPDMNKRFIQDEVTFVQNKQLPLPGDVLLQTLKEPDYAEEMSDKVGKMHQDLGRKKVHLSTTKTAKRKNIIKIRIKLRNILKKLKS